MKLYHISSAPPAERWQGTQVDAKNTAKASGGTFELREVPTDKPNLLVFLNDMEVTLSGNVEAAAERNWIAKPMGGAPMEVGGEATPEQIARRPGMYLDELERAELRAVAAATTVPSYQSPLSARSTLADIDAGMCATAIRQMDGGNLAKVVAAAIERVQQLKAGIREAADVGS